MRPAGGKLVLRGAGPSKHIAADPVSSRETLTRDTMSAQIEKIALFIDGANLYATAKSLGFDIDYKRLLREFQSRGYLLRAFYYTAVIEDQEYSSVRPLIDWLDYNGYTVVTKATKEFVDQTGRRKVKGNMDIELAVDAIELAPHIDQMVLFSGDGDFCLALLWQIFSGTGFPNQFFNDSWVVGFWRADHGRHDVELGRRASRMAQAVLGSPGP